MVQFFYGGSGDETFVGGDEKDFFVFRDGHGSDTIQNFTPGTDIIHLNKVSGVSQFSDLTITADGSDVLIDTGQGTIRLKNTGIDDVDAGCFGFRMDGGSGDDTLTGGAGRDFIYGGAGNDTIYGAGGYNFLDGGAGDDTIYGGAYFENIHGGAGNDALYGGGGGDRVFGWEGNDTLYGGAGDDRELYGGEGNDTIYGGAGDDRLFGGAGDDTLQGDAGSDVFYFAKNHGNDTIEDFTVGADNIHLARAGVSGFDDLTLTQDGSDVLIDTGQGTIRVKNIDADDLEASSFTFRIEGGSGDDTLTGGALDDYIYGGAGNDTLYGGAGISTDRIYGGAGNDTLYGGAGGDMLAGGAGDDTLYGGANPRGVGDSLFGGSGDDELYGGTGIDLLVGGNDDDTLYGGAGDDTLNGDDPFWLSYSSNGTVSTGNDKLYGGAGDDTLDGGAGNDTLDGGAGDDTLDGGAGNDTFVFGASHGNDTVEDFTDGEDTIDLSAITGLSGFADLTLTQSGDDITIDTGQGTILLKDVDIDDLDATDFLFQSASTDSAVEGL